MLILILWISGVLSLHNPQNDNIFDLLDSIRNKIIHSEEKLELKGHVTKFPRKEPHSVHQHYENYHHFVQNTWRSFTHDLPVIVIGCALNYNRLGNRIGSLLTDIACAGMSGAHIILIDTANRTITQPNDVFFDSIPHVVVHPNPAQNRSMVLTKYLKICADGRFPWVSVSYAIDYIN